MVKPIRFSLDIDGVVANYNKALAALAKELHYEPLQQQTGKPGEYEMVPDTDRLDEWIESHLEQFWGGLESMATEADHRAIHQARSMGHELFWVSARPSNRRRDLRRITLEWLQTNGFPVDEKHMLLLGDKGHSCRSNQIAFHLDDRVAHGVQVALAGTTCFMILRPWNAEELEYSGYGFLTVESIEEYITLITTGNK